MAMDTPNNRSPARHSTEMHTHAAPASITDLFERYHQEVYRLCLGMLADGTDAEDATQEVFIRAHRAWPTYDPQRAAPRTWLGQITMNYCRSVLRRRRVWALVQRLLSVGAVTDSSGFANRELRIDLSNAVGLLDEQHRSVILLRYYLEFSCAEIAQTLGINESTVHSRLYTARRRLHEMLSREG